MVYPLFDTVYSGNRSFCEGDTLEVLLTRHQGGTWSGSGVTGRTFSPKISGLGVHAIKVDSVGFCGNSASYNFEVFKMPIRSFPDTVLGCTKNPVSLDAQNSGAIYLWNTGSTSKTIVATISGNYWVKIVNGKCEITDSTKVKITEVCVGISAIHSAKSRIKIYPNPSSDFINLETEGEVISNVKVLSLSGQVLKNIEINSSFITLDLSDYSKGSYLIQVTRNEAIETYRIVVE